MGPRRLLELAKKCKSCEVFTHVSTCYVNSEKRYDFKIYLNICRGYIDEKIYNYPGDPDEIVNRLLNLSEAEILG